MIYLLSGGIPDSIWSICGGGTLDHRSFQCGCHSGFLPVTRTMPFQQMWTRWYHAHKKVSQKKSSKPGIDLEKKHPQHPKLLSILKEIIQQWRSNHPNYFFNNILKKWIPSFQSTGYSISLYTFKKKNMDSNPSDEPAHPGTFKIPDLDSPIAPNWPMDTQ